jgi:thioredoxin-related protein
MMTIYIKTMKKLLLFFTLIIAAGCIQAQNKGGNTGIPHYKILQVDSTYTTWADLKKDKPMMLVYFSPDCPHCQKFTLEMKQKMAAFKNTQVVMISFNKTEYPWMGMLRNFNRDYQIYKYKNITLGTEYPNYLVQRFFNIETTPYIAIYNKAGKLVQGFSKEPDIDDVIVAIKKAEK